ncbi:hypothetical protein LTR84_010309 [Exophiala bonariae]|uniref:Secreted protein n=1 Tax=Exophiala bonariae TaxID=1690606 RepID=A0AAV9MWI6_9EURO|nr:hypothetical protein LTR84_010309 [Exophiala bonariae]
MFGFHHVLTTLTALWAVLSSSTDDAVIYYRDYVAPYLFEPLALAGPSPPPASVTYPFLNNDEFARNQVVTMAMPSRTQMTTSLPQFYRSPPQSGHLTTHFRLSP